MHDKDSEGGGLSQHDKIKSPDLTVAIDQGSLKYINTDDKAYILIVGYRQRLSHGTPSLSLSRAWTPHTLR
jgi:hypothetical protein